MGKRVKNGKRMRLKAFFDVRCKCRKRFVQMGKKT